MKKSERIILGFVLGAVPPVAGLLTFWWGSLPFLSERLIFVCAALGLVAGFIVDIGYLKKWIAHAYTYDLKIWMSIYGFYSVCIFGFFMGVPAFNVFLAVPAGFFIGGKLAHRQADGAEYRRFARGTCIFTTLVLALVCLAAAVIAIRDPYTGDNLRGMLRLGFEVTPAMIGWIIVLGGAMLLSLQWWITSKMIRLAYRWIC